MLERLRQQVDDSKSQAERASLLAADVKEREGGLLARERSLIEQEAMVKVKEAELRGREERLAKVMFGSFCTVLPPSMMPSLPSHMLQIRRSC